MAQYDFGDSRIVACVTVKQDNNIPMSKVIGMIKQRNEYKALNIEIA